MEKVKVFIVKVLKDKNILQCIPEDITLLSGSDQKNYFSRAYHVKAVGSKNGLPHEEHLFLKIHGESEERNKRVKIGEKFKREALLYNEVMKEYTDLQKAIPTEQRLSFPTCYYADEEWLLMEHLVNYKSVHDRALLDLEQLEVMMEHLAKFHALSFVLRKKKPDVFQRLSLGLQKPNTGTKERREFIASKVWEWTMESLDEGDTKRRLEGMKGELLKEYDSVEDTDFSVILHADYNQRNVMFRYDEKKKICDIRMIDFQLSYISSPVADLFFLMFSSTDGPTRRQNYTRLLDSYHKDLQSFIALLGCDPDECYPSKLFHEDLKTYFPREFITILVIVRLMCIAFKDDDKPGESTILDYNSDSAERVFGQRIREVIEDLAHFGYI